MDEQDIESAKHLVHLLMRDGHLIKCTLNDIKSLGRMIDFCSEKLEENKR
jgi:hypothetical protein